MEAALQMLAVALALFPFLPYCSFPVEEQGCLWRPGFPAEGAVRPFSPGRGSRFCRAHAQSQDRPPGAPMPSRKEAVTEEMRLHMSGLYEAQVHHVDLGKLCFSLCQSSSSLLKKLVLESTMAFPELATERKTKQKDSNSVGQLMRPY